MSIIWFVFGVFSTDKCFRKSTWAGSRGHLLKEYISSYLGIIQIAKIRVFRAIDDLNPI